MGSAAESTYQHAMEIAQDILNPLDTEGKECELSIARKDQSGFDAASRIAGVIMWFDKDKIGKAAHTIQQKVPEADIHTLDTHLFSPKGGLFRSGLRGRAIEERTAIMEFAKSQGWEIPVNP